MDCSLRRDLDFKLVFDVLAGANGLVRLSTLQESWPDEPGNLPRGCLRLWEELATRDGYLDWKAFATGVERALKDDRFRLGRAGSSSPTKAQQTLQSLQGVRRALQPVTSEEMELYLSNCDQRPLVQALARTRKEVYTHQRSLHASAPSQRSSATPVHWQPSPSTAGTADTPGRLRESGTKRGGEEEAVVRGLELLQKAERWYRHRLNYLSLEERTKKTLQSKNAQAEDVLALLEADHRAPDSERHIQGINAHLRALMAEEQPVRQEVEAATQQTASANHCTRRQSLYDLLSAGSLQRHAKTPQRSLSVTPADHRQDRRRTIKRSLSLKGTLADYQHNSSQLYPLRAVASVREVTFSQQGVAKATGLSAPMKKVGVRRHPPAQPQHVTPTHSLAEAGTPGEGTWKNEQAAPVTRRHRRQPPAVVV